ncbi:MAG TPA: hypothetical protein ENI88_06520 [Desulfobulbus sp.]|nr:hypothetical protein [Desulfobulbus sp.]
MAATERKVRKRRPRIEKERRYFTRLIAENPNYFGTTYDKAFKPVLKKWKQATKYEELTCVGYNHNLEMLEATIQIKRSFGYGGSDLCDAGSTEYVRFFLDYGDGWEDCGLAAVRVHDIETSKDCAKKSTKPLTYVVTRPITPKPKWCNLPVLPKVRAILSWSKIPGNDPYEPTIWGNVLERNIQIKPSPALLIDIIESVKKMAGPESMIKLPKAFEEAAIPVPIPEPPELSIGELAVKYKAHKARKILVQPHRFGIKDLEAATSPNTLAPEALTAKIAEWESAKLNWAEALVKYEKTKGNVTFEELNCLGLDCNRDWLVATFVVKRPSGFNGGLCDNGSREYITFWADWDNSCKWVYQGTSWIDVHDIKSIPDEGLHYTVICPVDLGPHRQDCDEGPKISQVRAVLSWNTPPSPINPNALPKWGNRLDTHVQIKPKSSLTGSLAAIGGVGIQNIHVFGNGMTKSGGKFAFFDLATDPWDFFRECPFGGRIQFHGVPDSGSEYRILIRRVGDASFTVLDSKIWVTNSLGFSHYHQIKANGYFDTLSVNENIGSLLAVWDSHHEKTEDKNILWEARMEVKPSGGGTMLTPWYKIQLDNTAPSADIHIDSGGDCKDFVEGVTLTGRFVARDIHFGHYSIRTLPTSLSPTSPAPAGGTSQTVLAPGDAWSLNTSSMQPCGYVIELRVWDRTIVGSMPHQHNYARADLGFCLRKKKK